MPQSPFPWEGQHYVKTDKQILLRERETHKNTFNSSEYINYPKCYHYCLHHALHNFTTTQPEANILTLYHNYKSNISNFLYSLHNPILFPSKC
ncbi:hypothetical protein AMTRI_Chr04g187480 [Amborella trichopoda]